ncbi:MAG: Diphthamide biosynthesis protein 3 [Cyphobasidiales sp. Tagirdzhanova-0007]|nr:MAG: Diphthamide biosynthesis protein 3 [Cyphobasidiales sp. Tagirdzhanova-0007]
MTASVDICHNYLSFTQNQFPWASTHHAVNESATPYRLWRLKVMVTYYDEVEIEDMTWDEQASVYHWPCPCGDRFEITRVNITRLGGAVQARYLVLVEARKADFSMFQPQLAEGYDVGQCPSCSLLIRIIFDQMDFEKYGKHEDSLNDEKNKPEIIEISSNLTMAAITA